jgi:peptidoglycan hydrolase-like protein with peptidoglycan-binding domain
VSSAPLGPSSSTPGNVPTKDKGAAGQPGTFSLDVPNSRRGPAVADVQKALIALGYPLPKHGVDGIRGPETVAAVKQFQQANNLTVDGDPGKETVAKLNAALAAKPEIAAKLTKSTTADVKSKPADNSAGAASVGAIEINDENTAAAKKSAEKFLGRSIDDNEWNYLIRATAAESSPNTKEEAYIIGVILNRARSGKWGNSIISVLNAPSQFQAVTGTKYDPGPSPHFTKGPTKSRLASILKGAIEILPSVDKSLMNFTAANAAAYGPGTNLGFRDKLLAKGGQQIGQSIFGTA